MSLFATRLPRYLLTTISLWFLAQLAVVPAQGQTQITDCATVITAPGDYILANDLSCPQEGIRILTGGVNLNLNHHRISSTNPRSNNGITIHDAHATVDVRGPGEISGFNVGVDITASPALVGVVGLLLSGNNNGVFASGSRIGVYENTATGGTYGFLLRVDNADVAENTASQNMADGFLLQGAHNYIRLNHADRNHHGIATFEGSGVDNQIYSNTALNNGYDLYEGNPECRNDWHDNTSDHDNKDCIH